MRPHQARIGKRSGPTGGGGGDLDAQRVEAYALGRATLAETVGVTPEVLAELRRQARALFDTGRWAPCLEVVSGLVLLGDLDAQSFVLAAECSRRLGAAERAREWLGHAELVAHATGVRLDV